MTHDEQIARIRLLVNELGTAFENLEGVEYKIIIESYDEDGSHVYGAEESNNWERSWC